MWKALDSCSFGSAFLYTFGNVFQRCSIAARPAILINFSQHCIRNGMPSSFSSTEISVSKEGKLCPSGTLLENLCVLDTHVPHSRAVDCIADVNPLHERLGHVFQNSIKQKSKDNVVTGLQILNFDVRKTCSSCKVGKLIISNIPKYTSYSRHNVLDVVQRKVHGLMDVNSKREAPYFVTLIDNASVGKAVLPTAPR